MLARNTKNEKKCSEKKELVFENVENNENETKETRYFVERDRNRSKKAKNETIINKHIFEEKEKRNTRRGKYKKGKTRRYTKGKQEKRDE